MKKFKKFLTSLINNNQLIDQARHGKWWLSIIIFLASCIVAAVPVTVRAARTHGDDMFKTSSYNLREPSVEFLQELDSHDEWNLKVVYEATTDSKHLAVTGFESYTHTNGSTEKADLKVVYLPTMNSEGIEDIKKDKECTYLVLTEKEVYLHLVNLVTGDAIMRDFVCTKAYEGFEDGFDMKSMLSKDVEKSLTENMDITWSNWMKFYRNAYNNNRIFSTWTNAGIMVAINVVITFIMGLMVFILTRGKNNPYKFFTFWESQKISYWSTLAPAILTLALGFLMTNFANTMFPMLVGVRVMWMSMKSLRPDGSGYAAS